MTIYDQITIRISWEEPSSITIESDFEHTPFLPYYQSIFSNWDEFKTSTNFAPRKNTGSSGCDLLIITHPDFRSEVEDFSNWKHAKGYMTTVVDTDETGTTASDIGDYIQNAYDSWDPRPSYVLFIGDIQYVTTNYLYIHPYSGGYTASDLWYVTVDGSDYYPDIFMGRVPADSTSDIETFKTKVFGYEKTPPSLESFYENVDVAAYFQDYNPEDGYEDRRFVRTSEEIRDYLLGLNYDVLRIYCTPAYVNPTHYNNGYYGNGEPLPPDLLRPTFAWDGDAMDIINSVNDGVLILNHRDHGAVDYWGDPYFDMGHINSLSNGELLPIVFSINCQTGWYDDGECFCEAFIEKTSGGAVGIFGATRVSYSGYNDYLCRGFYDSIWPSFDTQQGSTTPMYTMGQVLNYGKTYMANTWGDPWDYERVTFEMFHWFGDPTMEIWTDIPDILDVDHPSEVSGNGEITVTVCDQTQTPIEGALVCISNDNNLYGRGYTDENGEVTIDLGYLNSGTTPIIAEDALLVVTAHDYLPYEATITSDITQPGDANGDGVVNFQDLIIVIFAWGSNPGHAADFNGDGTVNFTDLLIVFINWG
jgi:hypothetical protein